MNKAATFSPCGKYRYVLARVWNDDQPKAMCIGLNPSTANAEDDDPTIRRLIGLLKNNGYGGFYMCNLFALISPFPDALRMTPDPIKSNDIFLKATREISDAVVFCWGNFKQAEYRARKIIPMFPGAWCFGKNANGTPKHPLYLKADTKLQLFQS